MVLSMTSVNNIESTGEYVTLDGEQYFRIANSHLMPEFFMSLVGSSDHWMFVSSNGSLTAGRRNADNALFPYASDDQISAARSSTGSTTLIRSGIEKPTELWEPFAHFSAGQHTVRQNLYKTPLGTKLVFEEINESLGLSFRYRWVFSDKFGFVRTCSLRNIGQAPCSLELLDGLRNILPYGVASDFMMRFSNLANAYKKTELVDGSNLALFLLSSIPTDKAEPSEGLKATTVWQSGLSPDAILLSTNQISAFRENQPLQSENDVRGKAGAFLLNASIELAPDQDVTWHIVAELAQDHSDVIGLDQWLKQTSDLESEITNDIKASEYDFVRILSSSDAFQCGANKRRANRHLSNTVFNVMRGGIPLENYLVYAHDFAQHVTKFNKPVYEQHSNLLGGLEETQSSTSLQSQIEDANDAHLTRLAMEYLPLAFSRRHGDPTRPWNRFSIDLHSDNGRTNLNYQGNWRDIFQNWEALAVSFPEFSTAMICRFVNATTADGYNPYRVTKDGFEWEEPEPDDPWANIGYWGDHQIIYLQKLLEWNRNFYPERLGELFNAPAFVHANVPYRIKSYQDIKKDPQSTIVFDHELQAKINEQVSEIGADGKLLRNCHNQIHYVTLLEKFLTLSLAKMSNFVPDGGIWLNTQRPEWNDANNALVGNGLSMVTTCYLQRWFVFLHEWISELDTESFSVSVEVGNFFSKIADVLSQHANDLSSLDSAQRLAIVDGLSQAGSDYREGLYKSGLSGDTTELSKSDCLAFFETARIHIEATIRSNKRTDGLYNAYNLVSFTDSGVEIEYLYEMLEGQVAVLSAGLLSAEEAVELLDTLRHSALYRENQQSYVLYPDRKLPRFLDKNKIDSKFAESNELLSQLLENADESIVTRDVLGGIHFNGQFRNSNDLALAIDSLNGKYKPVGEEHRASLIQEFEKIFEHRRFTGRSGTFFGYEGLGSIYWHMVSKLGLAVSENLFAAIKSNAFAATISSLQTHLDAIRDGIGCEKSPPDYGAFPSDPYSHTPENAGVKQPGMTGQVKEDLLARFAEVGVHIEKGRLSFRLDLFDRNELLTEPGELEFYDLNGDLVTIPIPESGFGLTLCQVPIIYQVGESDSIVVHSASGETKEFAGVELDDSTSQQIFSRSGTIHKIECRFETLNK